MQPTPRRTTKPRHEVKKDETPSSSKKEEKKTTPSTPRNFVQKSSTADIYGQRKQSNVHVPKTPKKIQGVSKTASNVSPMKDLLKASPSTVRVIKPAKVPKDIQPPRGGKTGKDLSVLNVTVNSPIAKRKLLNEEINKEKSKKTHVIQNKNSQDKHVRKSEERNVDLKSKSGKTREGSMHVLERQRTKTRTLDETEVKILTTQSIDNNKEMLILSQKLKAKPKAFFVELDDEKTKMRTEKSSDEEISYEDDFESYESDFESYHSDENGDEESLGSDEEIHQNNEERLKTDDVEVDQSHVKDVKDEKDEERMLDSGNYDLRDRSAKSKPAVMEFILEDSEDPNDKKISLTDEGFLEMSSSSTVSSLKTIHVEVLDRPLFIDFTKSRENKRKRLINESFKQRARDLLSMITLHEMSFVLFEMKPVSYDLYMATFGRNNYTQTAVQTFDDGINVEIQTDMVDNRHVWTQYPVEFSKSNITIQKAVDARKYSRDTQELLNQFTFLNEDIKKETLDTVIDKDLVYESNPLRIYFEQKDGVGTTEMLPYETYDKKIKNTGHNSDRLRKFLKKFEGRVSNILNFNAGNIELSGLKNSRLPCSKGYVSISNKTIEDDKYSYLKRSKINKIVYSNTKNNLLFTICNKKENFKKCKICLWDINVARKDPIKILIAIDNVKFAEHTGSTDGIFIASLDDGSLHLWDLSEAPIWQQDVTSVEKPTNLLEIKNEGITDMERDSECNLKNSNDGDLEFNITGPLQSCAYTNSAYNITNGDQIDDTVALELYGDTHAPISQDGGRKIMGQVATLQRIGVLTIWSIIHEKSKTLDIGKAYWSKLKLEKVQNIHLLDYIDAVLGNNKDNISHFNLSLAKRRVMKRKEEKCLYSRSKFEIDRPTSATSVRNKKVLSTQNSLQFWENIVICNDIKAVNLNNVLIYIIAKDNGEVLCCRRVAGVFKVQKLLVTNDTSSITCLEASAHNLPYFLAATESGTVNLCSLHEMRVLLTLDCRNVTPTEMERCKSDHKGRYVSSVQSSNSARCTEYGVTSKISITSLQWSHVNTCCLYALLKDGTVISWDLTQSDIYAKVVCENINSCVASANNLVLLTSDGEVQIHKLTNDQKTKEYVELFKKYVALL